MDYFRILNFNKEPFSNSPDPGAFFQSRQHLGCLQKLELAIRLRRGLNVVIGDVGTGKTTLCRQLIRRFAGEENVETHLLLDPYFSSPSEFLSAVAGMFGTLKPETGMSEWQLRESIKKYLYRRGVDEQKSVVLIIDEGQKIPDFCLEILREFLNYEINEYKLLQILVLAQREFQRTIEEHANFADRINAYLFLDPLNFRETRSMIRFRLNRASTSNCAQALFSYPALWAIYRATGGYPRKIINLCHQVILALIIQNSSRAGRALVRSCVQRVSPKRPRSWQWATATVMAGSLALLLMLVPVPGELKIPIPWKAEETKIAFPEKEPPRFQMAIAHTGATPLQAHEATGGAKPEASPEILSPAKSLPDILGRITARQGETVLGMIRRLHGVFAPEDLESVARLNPHIKDLDVIEIGDMITFPALPAACNPLPSEGWWVEVASRGSLEEVYKSLMEYRGSALPVRILPYWNSQEGLKFAILLKNRFIDERSARNALEELPEELVADARILTKWEEGTVFFASSQNQLSTRKDKN